MKNHFIVGGEYKITLIKLQNSKWAKIHFKTTNSSKKKKYGYIHAKNIHANDLSLNYGITKKSQSKIYLKASKNAKVQKKLPARNRVKVIHGVGNGNTIWGIDNWLNDRCIFIHLKEDMQFCAEVNAKLYVFLLRLKLY